ncbi:MAG: glycosyltransferase family 4 protein [Bacteroidetes bacterium]|nr:glycosyltransferase family 4 protein [Bacteroidota bacterium]
MKIVYFINYIHASGGMERMVVNKANAFVDKGIDVSIVTCLPKDKNLFFEIDSRVKIVDTNIDYQKIEKRNALVKSISHFFLNIKHKAFIKKYLFENKVDIAISMHKEERRFLPFIKDGSKKIIEIHYDKGAATFGHNKFRFSNLIRLDSLIKSLILKKSFAEIVEMKMISRYDKFIVLTHEDAEQWGNLSNISVIPNFINSRPILSNCENKNVISVGRYNVVKGYDMLINSWAEVVKNDIAKGWHLNIYGEGELKKKLQNQINNCNLQSYITLNSATQHIVEKYAESSIYILSSRSEGFPMVLLEAMSAGIPAISFACKCGPKDMILNGESGFIIDKVGDVNTMAYRIIELMKDDNKRKEMGRLSSQRALLFSEKNVVSKWIKLFEELSSK